MVSTANELDGGHMLELHLINCQTAFESSRIARFMMDIAKEEERFTTESICINWVVT